MVNTSRPTKLHQAIMFGLVLLSTAVAVTALSHFRIGNVVLRTLFLLFNLGSILYVLSRIGEAVWCQCGRLAPALVAITHKESANGQCD